MTEEKKSNTAEPNQHHPMPASKRSKHREWSGATVGAVFGLGGLFLGRMGLLWVRFDVFAEFWVQFLLLSLASALGLIMPKYKTLVASVAFVSAAAAYSAWPYVASAGNHPVVFPMAANEKALRIASFNTYLNNLNTGQIALSIQSLDADVINLIEFDARKQPVLDQLRSIYPYQETCLNVPDCDFAIISKFPLSNTSAMVHWEGPAYMRTTMGPEFGNATIIATHTTRFPYQRAQFTQVKALVKLLEAVQGRVILMGDFNATPFSRITQLIVDSLGFSRLTSLPTWPATYGLPQLAIDHIFISQGIRALDGERIGDAAGSDHFPITITLGIKTN